jgi:hypothetical protein
MIARICNMELPHARSQVLNRGVIARILSNFHLLLASLAERGCLSLRGNGSLQPRVMG